MWNSGYNQLLFPFWYSTAIYNLASIHLFRNCWTSKPRKHLLFECSPTSFIKCASHDKVLSWMLASHWYQSCFSLYDLFNIDEYPTFSPIDRDKDKRTSLAKAYRNLIQNVWSEHPPSSIAPTSVLYAVKLVGRTLKSDLFWKFTYCVTLFT